MDTEKVEYLLTISDDYFFIQVQASPFLLSSSFYFL